MSYKFFEDIAVADVAFEAYGKTLEEMFESAGLAVTNTMVKDLSAIEPKIKKEFTVKSDKIDMLLFDFLQEIVFYKDSEKLLLGKFKLKVDEEKCEVSCVAEGEELDIKKHDLTVDVKAVTFHKFEVEKTDDGWKSQVILDI